METAKVDIRKLQLLNDRINQCIDALNQVRLSVHGLSGASTGVPGGIGAGQNPAFEYAVHAGILPRVRGIPAADRGFRNRDESADGGLDPYEPGCARRIPPPRVGRPSSDGEDRANVPLRAVAGPAHRDDLLK